jgi:enediyne polyketide synthase
MMDSPVVRDAFLHAVQACVPEHRILPISIESVDARGFRGGHVFLNARERQRDEKEFVYDLDVFDEAGRCVERIRGYRCRILDEFRDVAALAHVRSLHDMAAQRAHGDLAETATETEKGGIDAAV